MKTFLFKTKAETLQYLYDYKHEIGVEILKPFFFTVKEWATQEDHLYEQLLMELPNVGRLIVRSSARAEDSATESMAGKYESVICDHKEAAFKRAVAQVIESYGTVQPEDQVLVQEAVEGVEYSGVVFTFDPNTGGRYYVINYDDSTGSTSSVTSGTARDAKLYYWFVNEKFYPEDKNLRNICCAVRNLEKLLGNDALDIEFLISDGGLYILQVRPLILRVGKTEKGKEDVLQRISDKIRYENRNKPFLFGRRTIYGVMPDWNPAEMIGIHPKNLAASLYREIITDEVWAYQRDNYGYKKLRSFPLMVDFCGFPYIDVRVSFNSFIPADLDADIAEKLVNYYLDRLEESPDKHDKIEFDIVFSCYTFDLPKRIKVLEEYGFTKNEIDKIVDSLRNLTNKITNSKEGLWKKDASKLAILSTRRKEIEESDLCNIDKVFWLLEDCKRYGTLPFAGLARAGFIAVQLLKSMVENGIITEREKEAFMNDLQSVSSSMKRDYNLLSKNDFLLKYGFLRPGTYDICSQRYDEASGKYFTWKQSDSRLGGVNKKETFRLSLSQMENIRNTLQEHQLGDDVLELFDFIKGAIEGREQAKFIFTRNVSDILKYLGEWGAGFGFSREEMAFSSIQIIKDVYNGAESEKDIINQSIQAGKRKYEEGNGIVLPPLIVSEKDIKGFFIPDSQPTFVTLNRVEGEICKVENKKEKILDGKILLIESADPGYDWIFSHNIKGFITKYGGANSHMAIRAGELSLPAVVGAGQKLFERLLQAEIVEIDAPLKQIHILR